MPRFSATSDAGWQHGWTKKWWIIIGQSPISPPSRNYWNGWYWAEFGPTWPSHRASRTYSQRTFVVAPPRRLSSKFWTASSLQPTAGVPLFWLDWTYRRLSTPSATRLSCGVWELSSEYAEKPETGCDLTCLVGRSLSSRATTRPTACPHVRCPKRICAGASICCSRRMYTLTSRSVDRLFRRRLPPVRRRHHHHHIRLFVAWQNACHNNRNVKNVHITYRISHKITRTHQEMR